VEHALTKSLLSETIEGFIQPINSDSLCVGSLVRDSDDCLDTVAYYTSEPSYSLGLVVAVKYDEHTYTVLWVV
jgi:hypothetical protein